MNTAKIDLHLHLDGSLNMHWAWQTAVKRGVVAPECTFEQYYDQMHRTKALNALIFQSPYCRRRKICVMVLIH